VHVVDVIIRIYHDALSPERQIFIVLSIKFIFSYNLCKADVSYEGTLKLQILLIQCVPLATEPGVSLIILTPMKILQRNLNRSTFVV